MKYFRLAGVMLACRLAQTQGASDPVWHFIGEMDYAAEMGKVLQEVQKSGTFRSITPEIQA